jgi:ectoine hydroxylase-related dioxygenase (phytanoyl-CoA dioxygenase family)
MAQIQRVQPSESVAVINEILEHDGCIVIENIMGDKLLKKLRSELYPILDKTRSCNGDFYGRATKRLSSLIAKSEGCRELAIHPTVLAVMDKFLLKSCKEYQLNLTQAIQIWPGEPKQMMHPDDPMFPFMHPGNESMINCMYAVDDFTAENGATHVVPGSHKWERNGLLPEREPKPNEVVQGEMKAGSMLVYFGSLLHHGGANTTENPRTGLVMSYCLGWLRQSENQYLAVPLELAKTLPERLQKLIGYFVHAPNLGQVEGRDPIEILQDKNVSDSLFEEYLPPEVQPYLEKHKALLKAA